MLSDTFRRQEGFRPEVLLKYHELEKKLSKTIYVTLERAVSHKQLSVARYQVTFYARNDFECRLQIVSSSFKM